MGNLPSSRRNSSISQNPPQPARMIPPPPGYPGDHVPFYYPPNYNGGVPAPQYFHHNFIANNGPYVMTPPQLQPYSRPPQGPPPPPNPPRAIPEVAEQKANTIRNDVNLKKATLRLEQDEENPGYHLVAFTFDAMVAGRYVIVLLSFCHPSFSTCSLICRSGTFYHMKFHVCNVIQGIHKIEQFHKC